MNFPIVQSPFVGGVKGSYFDDLVDLGYPGSNKLNLDAPIASVGIAAGWIIDGISFTYNMADGTKVTKSHGSRTISSFSLASNESLLAIVGRAGYQRYYKQSYVNQLTFVIVNTATLAVRTLTYGNGNGSSDGELFTVSNPIGAAGYSDDSSTSALGLGGLSFFSAVSSK